MLPDNSPLAIAVGETADGWCKFEVRFGDRAWRCSASYMGQYPLCPLIHAAVELPREFDDAEYGWNDDQDAWDCMAVDEPGGIVLRLIPLTGREERRMRLQVFHSLRDNLGSLLDKPPEAEGVITLDAFARAVYAAAADALARQGITELSLNWESHLLTRENTSLVVFPVDRFLHLHLQLHSTQWDGLRAARNPLAADLAILQEILSRDGRR
jgi:hypothetical protein